MRIQSLDGATVTYAVRHGIEVRADLAEHHRRHLARARELRTSAGVGWRGSVAVRLECAAVMRQALMTARRSTAGMHRRSPVIRLLLADA